MQRGGGGGRECKVTHRERRGQCLNYLVESRGDLCNFQQQFKYEKYSRIKIFQSYRCGIDYVTF